MKDSTSCRRSFGLSGNTDRWLLAALALVGPTVAAPAGI